MTAAYDHSLEHQSDLAAALDALVRALGDTRHLHGLALQDEVAVGGEAAGLFDVLRALADERSTVLDTDIDTGIWGNAAERYYHDRDAIDHLLRGDWDELNQLILMHVGTHPIGFPANEREGRLFDALGAADPTDYCLAWDEIAEETPERIGGLRTKLPDPDQSTMSRDPMQLRTLLSLTASLGSFEFDSKRTLTSTTGATSVFEFASSDPVGRVEKPRQSGSPAQQGASLERSLLAVFERFLDIDPTSRRASTKLRRQRAGSQGGFDLAFNAEVRGSTTRCRVECKSIAHAPTVDDVAGKLLQAKRSARDASIDHWILVSPYKDPNNELDQMLDDWEVTQEWPFSVQVWSPQNGVRELLALDADAFEAVYGIPPDVESAVLRTAVQATRERLVPRARLPASLGSFVSRPSAYLLPSESSWREILPDAVRRSVTDRQGALLSESAEDYLVGWCESAQPGDSLLCLAEFGEGKSFLAYATCERLRQRFLQNPKEGTIPIRIQLRNFRGIADPQVFLDAEFARLGLSTIDLHSARQEHRLCVILDGLDEISIAQDAASVLDVQDRLDQIRHLLANFPVVVTSRPTLFRSSRERENFMTALGNPVEIWLGKPLRDDVVHHLERFARNVDAQHALSRVRGLYDPVGLAGKLLFLEMLKATLKDLPSDDFNEFILYDTYVRKALARKAWLLRDPTASSTEGEVYDALLRILERVALDLHVNGDGSVDLRDYEFDGSNLASHLWATTEDAAEDDAARRVGTRSLLHRINPDTLVAGDSPWQVDFFHRSMQEYFVARLICRTIRERDFSNLRALLIDLPLEPVILRFVRMISEADSMPTADLESLLSSALITGAPSLLGGNSASLLHAANFSFKGKTYRGLSIDGAYLRNADLSAVDFSGSSLIHADIVGADLRGAVLDEVNLEFARLTEDATARFIVGTRDGRVIILTAEGKLASWRPDGAEWRPVWSVDFDECHDANRIGWLDDSTLLVCDAVSVTVLNLTMHEPVVVGRVRLDPEITGVIPLGDRSILASYSDSIVRLMNVDSRTRSEPISFPLAEGCLETRVASDVTHLLSGSDDVVGWGPAGELHLVGSGSLLTSASGPHGARLAALRDNELWVCLGDGWEWEPIELRAPANDELVHSIAWSSGSLLVAYSSGVLSSYAESRGRWKEAARLDSRIRCSGASIRNLHTDREAAALRTNGALPATGEHKSEP